MAKLPEALRQIHNNVKQIALECMATYRHRSVVDWYIYVNKDMNPYFFEKIRRVWMILNIIETYDVTTQSDYKLTHNQLKEAMDILRGLLGYKVEGEEDETH